MTNKAQSSQHKAQVSKHKIGWLNLPGYKGETWNPIAGCSKVSPGCENCYAEKMATRLAAMAIAKPLPMSVGKYVKVIRGRKWDVSTFFNKEELAIPLKWKKPRVVFVCSMGDLFHEDTSFQDIDQIFALMASCPQHIFIVLTKRAKRMAEYFNWKDTTWRNEGMQGSERIRYLAYHNHGAKIEFEDFNWPLHNVWLGVSAENQKAANERIPYLVQTPAAVRLVSVEPMLEPVDFELLPTTRVSNKNLKQKFSLRKINHLDWVICGGESGHKARPMHPDWVRSVRDQCKAAGVPFFFKQWGEWAAFSKEESEYIRLTRGNMLEDKCIAFAKVGKHKSGNLLDGERHEEYPKINL